MKYGKHYKAALDKDIRDERIHCVFPNKEDYKDYLDYEKNMNSFIKKLFTRKERLMIFCKYRIGWGALKVRKFTGIPVYKYERAMRKVKELYSDSYEIKSKQEVREVYGNYK